MVCRAHNQKDFEVVSTVFLSSVVSISFGLQVFAADHFLVVLMHMVIDVQCKLC